MKELRSMLIAGLFASIPSIILSFPSLNLIQIFIDIIEWVFGGIILGIIVLHFSQRLPGKTLFKKTFITGSAILIVLWIIISITILWLITPMMNVDFTGPEGMLTLGNDSMMTNFLSITIFNLVLSIVLSFVSLFIYSYVFSKLVKK